MLEQLRAENALLENREPIRPWSDIERAFVREKASFWTDKQMAREMVGRSESAVKNFRHQNGVPGRRGV